MPLLRYIPDTRATSRNAAVQMRVNCSINIRGTTCHLTGHTCVTFTISRNDVNRRSSRTSTSGVNTPAVTKRNIPQVRKFEKRQLMYKRENIPPPLKGVNFVE